MKTKFKLTTSGRVRDDVPEPAKGFLENVFDKDGKPNCEAIKEHFLKEGRLRREDALRIVRSTKAVVAEEPNMLEVAPPVTICGDLHGQYYDLVQLFKVAGDPMKVSFLFLGDYCDRGQYGCETLLLLYAYKLVRPRNMHLLRGNHECRHLTDYFNFKQEAIFKYGQEFYDAVCESWDHLPIAALLNRKFLCVHGGLSPELKSLDDINMIDRVQEPPAFGLMCDLLWSDPVPDYNDTDGSRGAWTYRDNSNRGCSYHFSFRAVLDFLHSNDLFSVIRGHEVMYPGFQMYKADPKNSFPSLITLFSAPNYCLAEDHQILTNRGFMFLEQLRQEYEKHDGLMIASFDEASHQMVYEPASRIIVNAYEKQQLVSFTQSAEGKRWSAHNALMSAGVSAVVTKEHNMFFLPEGASSYRKQVAGDLKKSGYQRVKMLQAAGAGVERLSAVHGVTEIDAERHGFELVHNNGSLAEWVAHAPGSLLKCVVRGMLAASGGSPSIAVGASVVARDAMVHMLLNAGFSASFRAVGGGGGGEWIVEYGSSSECVLDVTSEASMVEYEGRTWCVTVPHGLIFTRRARVDENGAVTMASRPIIVGNCDDHGNKGAILEYGTGNVMNIKQFSAVEHPYNLPNFGNVISWSFPFVAEKLVDFVTALRKIELEEEEEELDQQAKSTEEKHVLDEVAQRREVIRNKILAMGKMQMMFATLRKEKENIIKLKGLTGDNMLPKGVLLQGPNAIQASLEFFERSKAKHKEDEMMPIKAYENTLKRSDSANARKALFNLKKSHDDLAALMKQDDSSNNNNNNNKK